MSNRRPLLLTAAVAAVAAAAAGATLAATRTAGTVATPLRQGSTLVGPGPVAGSYRLGRFQLELRDMPNRASRAGLISVGLFKAGRPVDGARVKITLTMLDMAMGSLSAALPETAPGRYERPGPIVGMSGRWQLALDISPRGGGPILHLAVVDRMAP